PRYAPIVQIGWRHLSIGRVRGATAGAADMNALMLDWYPHSSYVRFGLSTEYARESSSSPEKDWYLAEHLTLGAQLPGVWTPFVEGSAGAGYLRRFVVGQEQPTAIWEF